MDFKQKVPAVLKKVYSAVLEFFNAPEKGKRRPLKVLDVADIFIALCPMMIFGFLLFGWGALAVLAVCAAVFVAFDYFWVWLVEKKRKCLKELYGRQAVWGLALGLTLSSKLNIFFVIAVALVAAYFTKTVFKNKPLHLFLPLLLSRSIFSILFFDSFNLYALPFTRLDELVSPMAELFGATPLEIPAKYLFFGLHSGNIGQTSVFLIVVSGGYLILRKIINPIIPLSFLLTSFVLSCIFGENLAIALLGGGLFFAAFFATLGYGFKTTPRYQKILYGVVCGVLTFVSRKILRTDTVFLCVLITELLFVYITRRNIGRAVEFVKNPDFKRAFKKLRKTFWV